MKRELVSYADDSVYKISALNIRQTTPHWHDTDIEIVFVLRGEVTLNVAYDNFQLKSGDFVVVNHEDIHVINSHDDNVTFLIHVDLASFVEKYDYIMYQDLMCESFNVNGYQNEYTKKLKKIFSKIILEDIKGSEISKGKISAYIEDALRIMVEHFDIANYYNDRQIPENQLLRYFRIMKGIALNYDEKITMEDIAQEEFIGKNYISQFWKKMLGINFTDYLNSRRTEIAQKLILTTNLNLQEISLKCGFSDSKYFYKNFKRWYGSTPAEHKKKYEQIENKIGNVCHNIDKELAQGEFNGELVGFLVEDAEDIIKIHEKQSKPWKNDFEKNMNSQGRRIKREMLKENQKNLGIKEIFLPLLDKSIVQIQNGEASFDWNFIGEVIKYSKEMNQIICIDINYSERSSEDWRLIIGNFFSFVMNLMGKECLARFRFYIFLSEMYVDAEVDEFLNYLCDNVDAKNIKIAARYK